MADRYRDRIVPGLGCDICPNHCKLLDLQRPSHEEFRRVFQQIVLDGDGLTNGGVTGPDPLFDDTPRERLLQRQIKVEDSWEVITEEWVLFPPGQKCIHR